MAQQVNAANSGFALRTTPPSLVSTLAKKMTPHTVFYSWQSDAPLDDCKHFIRADSIKAALKILKRDDEVIEAPRLDQDTKGEAGTPDVAATIYSKISACAVFVSDLTLVGTAQSKKMPNANVALEFGYAAAEIGWSRLVGVMNTASACGSAKELIFDLIHKRHPIEFSIDQQTVDRKKVSQDLADALSLPLNRERPSTVHHGSIARSNVECKCRGTPLR